MMNQFHVLSHPMFLYAGYSTTGHTKDLAPGILGIFDDKTGNAVTTATINSKRPIRFAQGSYHQQDALGTFYTKMKNSLKTADFLPQDVMHIEYSQFRKRQHEKWILGYDGLNNESLTFECGKTHRFRFRVFGQGVYDLYQKQIFRDIAITTACCDSDECTNGCPDNTLHCRKYTEELVKAVNSDVEISKFVRAEVVYPSGEADNGTQTHTTMSLTICDNGDQEALNAVQREYPTLNITRTARNGSLSTYTTDCMTNAAAAAITAYTPTSDVLVAVCNECPASYTFVGARDVYTVIVSNADYTSAATSKAAYETDGTTSAIATTDVNTTTNVITEASHGFVTGQKIKYENGGGADITGLVDGTTYYAIVLTANTFKVAATAADAFAGTAIALTGTGNNAQTFIPVFTVTELSQNATTTILQVIVESGVTVPVLGTEQVIQGNTIPATCSAAAASPVSWDVAELLYTRTRELTATISKDCGGNSRLAEIQAYYADNSDIVVRLVTAGDCEDVYKIVQTSNCHSAGACLSEELSVYDNVTPFEGVYWEVTTSVTAPDPTFYCGIRFEVSSSYNQFGVCSWVPEDFYTYKPTFMEVWQIEENGEPCKAQTPARKIQNAQQENQNGEWARREYINMSKYLYWDAFDSDPRFREILGQTAYQMIDLNAYYNVYYIKYKQYRNNGRLGNSQNPEVFEVPIVVKEGIDTTNFEVWLNQMFSPFGVLVQPREGQANY